MARVTKRNEVRRPEVAAAIRRGEDPTKAKARLTKLVADPRVKVKVKEKDSPPWPPKGKKAVVTPLRNNVPTVTKAKAPPADAMKLVEALGKANALTRKHSAAYADAKAKEDAIRADVLALFGKKKIDGMKHKLGTVSIVTTEYVEVTDMEAVLKAAKTKGNTDLLTVGVSSKAVRARWDDGKDVPGVKKGTREDLRFTPAKK